MTTVALIVVRMGSSRLPGKALLPILGRPMLALMIERVRRSHHVGRIVLATSTSPADDPIEALAGELVDPDLHCYRGSEEDVLGRIAGALRAHPCDRALQLLGDNPLIHGDQIDAVCRRHAEGGVDYVATTAPELPRRPPALGRFPVGLRVEAFAPDVIAACDRLADDPYHREHATSFVHCNAGRFRIGWVGAPRELSAAAEAGISFAVNTRPEYEWVRAVFERLYPHDPGFSLAAVAELAASEGRGAAGGGPS